MIEEKTKVPNQFSPTGRSGPDNRRLQHDGPHHPQFASPDRLRSDAATDGEVGLHKMRAKKYDLVLCDWALEGIWL
jgi:hypothetical protein